MTTPSRAHARWRLGPFIEPSIFQVACTFFYVLDVGLRVVFGYRFGLASGPG